MISISVYQISYNYRKQHHIQAALAALAVLAYHCFFGKHLLSADKGKPVALVEILQSNPLEDMEYEKRDDDKNEVHYLTREQVRLLMSHPFEGKRMEFAIRMFVFTIFTGLAYIDLKELYPTHIETNVGGQRFIRKARKKTGVEAFIPPASRSGADTCDV